MSSTKAQTVCSAVREAGCFLTVLLVIVLVCSGVSSVVSSDDTPVSAVEEPESYKTYYNYVELTRRLTSLARGHPHIAKLHSIGRSVEDRELWVMRITKEVSADLPGKPKFKYVGNMHGDETVSRQVLVYLIEYLLRSYGDDQRVTELINSTDIYIMPSMNPDGFEKSVEGDCGGQAGGRNNARDMDLNRSFPDQFTPIHVSEADIPENTAMMKWILDNK